ncbi:hypothetical protein WP50_35945 [Lactiplantibacillus plantarum]|nr:hypothetical protein WP50_35945 [Lactiplantibacillus plantarum]
MKKSERQAVIEQLISEYPIATQEELMAKLKAEGIAATASQSQPQNSDRVGRTGTAGRIDYATWHFSVVY